MENDLTPVRDQLFLTVSPQHADILRSISSVYKGARKPLTCYNVRFMFPLSLYTLGLVQSLINLSLGVYYRGPS